jgi:hypothetical protein
MILCSKQAGQRVHVHSQAFQEAGDELAESIGASAVSRTQRAPDLVVSHAARARLRAAVLYEAIPIPGFVV